MTTTPLPPPSYPEYAKHGVSKGGEISKIVIRPALYTAEQMREYRADLEAENQRLIDCLERLKPFVGGLGKAILREALETHHD